MIALREGLGSESEVGNGWVGHDVVVVVRVDNQAVPDNGHLCPVRGSSGIVALDFKVTTLGRTATDIRAIHNVGAVGCFGTIEDTESPSARAVILSAFTNKTLDSPVGVR